MRGYSIAGLYVSKQLSTNTKLFWVRTTARDPAGYAGYTYTPPHFLFPSRPHLVFSSLLQIATLPSGVSNRCLQNL